MFTFRNLADFIGQDGTLIREGKIICYKAVTASFHDWWTGRVDNRPGTSPPPILDVDPSTAPMEGGAGYHFAGWAKAHEYGGSRRRFVVCEVSASDVVAITEDGVLRARAYKVLHPAEQPLAATPARRATRDPFATAPVAVPPPREVVPSPPPGPKAVEPGERKHWIGKIVKINPKPQVVSSALDGPILPVVTGHPFDALTDNELERATVPDLRKYATRLGISGAGKLRRLPDGERPGLVEVILLARYGGR